MLEIGLLSAHARLKCFFFLLYVMKNRGNFFICIIGIGYRYTNEYKKEKIYQNNMEIYYFTRI